MIIASRRRGPREFLALFRLGREFGCSVVLVLVLLCATGCQAVLEPDLQPFRDSGYSVWPVDADDDGTSEIVQVYRPGSNNNFMGVAVMELNGRVLHQVNVEGEVVRPLQVRRPSRRNAVLVSYYRRDSLWTLIVDAVGQRQDTVLVATGRPRIEPSGVFNWDPLVNYAEIGDLDEDGSEDLLTVVNTGYARWPRGVFLHDIASGRLVDSLAIGTGLHPSVVPLAPQGQTRRWLLGSSAPDNGTNVGPLDDRHSYLLDLVYDDGFRLARFRQMGGLFTDTHILTHGAHADELLVSVVRADPEAEASYLALVDPADLSILNRLELPGSILFAVAPWTRSVSDGAAIALSGTGDLLRIPATLDRSAIRTATDLPNSGSLIAIPDVNGDGLGDVLVHSPGRIEVRGNDLQKLAAVDLPGTFTGEALPLQESGSPFGPILLGGNGPSFILTFRHTRRMHSWLVAILAAAFGIVALVSGGLAVRRSAHLRAVAHLERNGLVRASPPETPSNGSKPDSLRSSDVLPVPPSLMEWLQRRRTVQRIDRAAGALSESDAAANNRWAARVALPSEAAAESEPLARIVAALDRQALNRDTTVASLAESLGMSQRHLQRTCEALFGLSPLELITRRRVLAAAERLAATDDLVKEIAWDCGFGPSGQLEAAFKKHFGALPTEYRAAARKT